MTICIAAVCESESGKKIVVAADRMLTYLPPTSLEFETVEQKIEVLAPSCIALASGNTAPATEILDNTRKKLRGNQSPYVDQVLEIVRTEYVSKRMAKFDETTITASLGADYAGFLQKGGTLPNYLQSQPQIYQQLVLLAQQFNLGVDIIIAGVDNSGAHISVVTHPGTTYSLDKLGYGAIGTGGLHATIHLALSGQTSRKAFLKTLYDVYVSKKIAEVAPGVGPSTDLAVVEPKGVWHCTEPVMEMLDKLYKDVSKKPSPSLDELKRTYDEQRKP